MKESYIEVTQKMADELNTIAEECGIEYTFQPQKIKVLYG